MNMVNILSNDFTITEFVDKTWSFVSTYLQQKRYSAAWAIGNLLIRSLIFELENQKN